MQCSNISKPLPLIWSTQNNDSNNNNNNNNIFCEAPQFWKKVEADR